MDESSAGRKGRALEGGLQNEHILSPSFLMETKLKEIHQHPDTTLSPLSAQQIGSHAGAPAKKPPHPSASCGQWTTLTRYQSCHSSYFTSVGIPPLRSSGVSKTWLKLGTRKAPRNTNISASRSHPHKSWLSWARVTWI